MREQGLEPRPVLPPKAPQVTPHHQGSETSALASLCLTLQSRIMGTIQRDLQVAGTEPGTEQTRLAAQGSFFLCFGEGVENRLGSLEGGQGDWGRPGLLREAGPPPSSRPQQGRGRVPAASVWVFPDTPFCADTSLLPWREARSSIGSDSHHLAGTGASTAQGQINPTLRSGSAGSEPPGRPAAWRLLSSLAAPPEGAQRGHAGPLPELRPVSRGAPGGGRAGRQRFRPGACVYRHCDLELQFPY